MAARSDTGERIKGDRMKVGADVSGVGAGVSSVGISVDISVVVPMHNEEGNVVPLHATLTRVLSRLNKSYEIILVDDGSTDGTVAAIRAVCKKDKRVRGIIFMRNFRKAAAYMAGFAASSGAVVITMDGDLQDDPEEIPRFLDALREYDLVVGWKYPRYDPWYKTIPSKVFKNLNDTFFGLRLHDYDCGYRAMKADVAAQLNLYGDIFRYTPAIVSRLGYRVGEIQVHHHPRVHGTSKFGTNRLLTGFLDLLTVKFILDFNQRPLHLFGGTGIAAFGVGFLAELYVLYARLFLGDLFVQHLPMLIFGVLLMLLGVQLLSIGLIGELITSGKKVQRYNVKETLN